jgi:hypothetical protein
MLATDNPDFMREIRLVFYNISSIKYRRCFHKLNTALANNQSCFLIFVSRKVNLNDIIQNHFKQLNTIY